MADMRPVRVFSLKVPPGGVLVDCNPGVPASLRITMAAIDPNEDTGDAPPRATLKIIHNVLDFMDEEDDDSDDDDDDDEDPLTMDDVKAIERRLGITVADDDEDDDEDMDDDEDEEEDEDDEDDEDDEGPDDEMVNGGPSDPEKRRIAKQNAILKAMEEAVEEDDDDDALALPNGLDGKLDKGKGRALELDDDDDISSSGMEEYVVCTLDRNMSYQQPLDITIRENEECYFRVSGGQTVYLTGNFVVSPEEIGSDDDDSDESDDEDIYGLNGLENYDEEDLEDESEEDELDNIKDPRLVELPSDEEAPQLVKAKPAKSKNKRPAEVDLEYMLEGYLGKAPVIEKSDKPQAKKLKNNAGQAVPGAETNGNTKAAKEVKTEEVKDSKKTKKEKGAKKEETPQSNGKKVQFAEILEQGPTPSKNGPAPTKGPRYVNGVTVDDKKTGTGPTAKKGDKVGMRYIGKLKDGRVFDSNKKGKPFTFKIGVGEVIKGWDVGVQGMSVGGERRITIPAKLGYGSKSQPQIPANSDLVFDLKMISIN